MQGYYLQAPFAVERALTAPLPGYSGSRRFKDVRVNQLAEYPVRGLVFECGQNLPDMADFVAEVCVRLQEANIPHNLFIVDCGMRVFLYPNGFAAAKAEVSIACMTASSYTRAVTVPCLLSKCIYFACWRCSLDTASRLTRCVTRCVTYLTIFCLRLSCQYSLLL